MSKGVSATVTTICNFVIMAIMCLAALVIAFTEQDEYEQCMKQYKGIKFSYLSWLKGTGFILIYHVIEMAFFCISIRSASGRLDEISLWIQGIFFVLYSLFMTAWITIGGILLFKEVHPGCSEDSTQWQFGLALFIVQIVCGSLYSVLKCIGMFFQVTA